MACDPPTEAPPVDTPPVDTEVEVYVLSSEAEVWPLHRLTKRALTNTVKHLLGESVDDAFERVPADDITQGFDNISSAQQVSLLHVEGYVAASRILAEAILASDDPNQRFEIEDLGLTMGSQLAVDDSSWWSFHGIDDIGPTMTVTLEHDGLYEVRVRSAWLSGWEYDALLPQMQLENDGATIGTLTTVGNTFDDPMVFSWQVQLTAGTHQLDIRLFRLAETSAIGFDWMEVDGPIDDTSTYYGTARQRLAPCRPTTETPLDCAQESLENIAKLAWRRPVSSDELASLTAIAAQGLELGLSFDEAMSYAVQAIFASPSFTYRVEDVSDLAPDEAKQLTPHELAARLSYTLWSSLPDDELRACADEGALVASGDLSDTCSVRYQVRRMLDDERSDVVATDFGVQWLQLERLHDAWRDPESFPNFDETVANAMAEQAERTLQTAHRERSDLRDLVGNTPLTWMHPTLADTYGLTDLPEGWTQQPSPEDRPEGLLGSAAFLTLASNPDRSSPIRRGQWVLGRLLCAEPAAPPPDIPELNEELLTDGGIRAAMEAHRADPTCNACHRIMDPVGLGLEHFNAVGQLRDTYPDGLPVDASSELPDGTLLTDSHDVSAWVASAPEFGPCLVEHLATWALERPPTERDEAALSELVSSAGTDGMSFHHLLEALATSPIVTATRGPTP
jgi:hypothetical protein